MGKRGPCWHCGIESTPLWRNGPLEKPVLCNACGSRYRQGKPLENYMPKHGIYLKPKRRDIYARAFNGQINLTTQAQIDASHSTVYGEGYISNDSSSLESTTSSPETDQSCFQIKGEEDGNEISDSKQATSWAQPVPSRKRTSVTYYTLSPIQQLQRDLYHILRNQGSSFSSESAEDGLIYDLKNNLTDSTEIGLGSILLNPPSTSSDQQETEKCPKRSRGRPRKNPAKANDEAPKK